MASQGLTATPVYITQGVTNSRRGFRAYPYAAECKRAYERCRWPQGVARDAWHAARSEHCRSAEF